MTTARFIVGDALTVLRSMPDASVDCIVSSPPYWRKRSYLPADVPEKADEIGQEPSPGEFLANLRWARWSSGMGQVPPRPTPHSLTADRLAVTGRA